MMNEEKNREPNPAAAGRGPSRARRRFLLLLPAAVFGSIAAGLGAAAYRFLRPRAGLVAAGPEGGAGWTAVAPVSELGGAEPLRRELSVALRAGWQEGRRDVAVFVLPREQNRVVSAACPHEGCEVEWRGEAGEFFCPCHDSRFGPGGEVLTGPAEQDLLTLQTRTTAGVLEVRLQTETAAGRACGGARREA